MQCFRDTPAAIPAPVQARQPEGLLETPPGSRVSDLDRLRRGPVTASGNSMAAALDRVAEIASLGFGGHDLGAMPKRRLMEWPSTAWRARLPCCAATSGRAGWPLRWPRHVLGIKSVGSAPIEALETEGNFLRLRNVQSSMTEFGAGVLLQKAGARVILAVLAAAILVTTGCSGSKESAAASSESTVSASVPGFLSLPLGGDKHTVTLWSWGGKQVSQAHTGPVADCCTTVNQSPDGSRILVWQGSGAEIIDSSSGKVLGTSADANGMWADDSQHLCFVRSNPSGVEVGTGELVLSDPGHSERVVAQVGPYGVEQEQRMAYCSIAQNEAIVFLLTMGTVSKVTEVSLKTGAITTPPWAAPCQTSCTPPVAVSGNGKYVLESRSGGGQIVDAASGKILGSLTGQPESISWDGNVVVEFSTQGTGTASYDEVQVVDWRTNTVLWTGGSTEGSSPASPCAGPNAAVAARPATDDLALDLSGGCGLQYGQGALWLIPAHGTAKLLNGRVVFGAV